MINITTYLLAFIILLIVYNFSKICSYVKYKRLISHLPTVDQPRYPFIGHLYLFPRDVEKNFETFYKIFTSQQVKGQNITYLKILNRDTLTVFDPQCVGPILRSSKNINKPSTYHLLSKWLGNGLLIAPAQKWKPTRHLLTPAFHFDILKGFMKIKCDKAKEMVKRWEHHCDHNDDVNIEENLSLCALDIICETAMGEKINAQTDKNAFYPKAVRRFIEIVKKRDFSFLLQNEIAFKFSSLKNDHDHSQYVLNEFSNQIIRNRIHEKKNEIEKYRCRKKAFLDLLLDIKTESGQILSLNSLKGEVNTFIFAGHDTTATALNWIFYNLGLHQDIQKKVYDEIMTIEESETNLLTLEDLSKLVYMEQVINETLRCYPPVTMFSRLITDQFMCDGYEIPEGVLVNIDCYSIHHNPKYWPNPFDFDPERFSKENSVNRHPFSFIPFSAGPRNCIGQKFAMHEIKVVTFYVIKAFHLTSLDTKEDITLTSNIILRSKDPLNIKLKKRIN